MTTGMVLKIYQSISTQKLHITLTVPGLIIIKIRKMIPLTVFILVKESFVNLVMALNDSLAELSLIQTHSTHKQAESF